MVLLFCSLSLEDSIILTASYSLWYLNPLRYKILALSELKEFSDDNSSAGQMVRFFLDKIENIVGKVENAYPNIFSFFPTLLKAFFPRGVKSQHRVGKC